MMTTEINIDATYLNPIELEWKCLNCDRLQTPDAFAVQINCTGGIKDMTGIMCRECFAKLCDWILGSDFTVGKTK